jgi:hypothetical protein
LHQNLANPSENNLQIQPYYGGRNNLGVSGSAMAASPANSGPIIAELIDELEENGNGGGIAGFGGKYFGEYLLIQGGEINSGYQQIGNNSLLPSAGGGQRMAVVVSSPMPMNELIPAEESSNFRGYSQSFGGQSAPPSKKPAYQLVRENIK